MKILKSIRGAVEDYHNHFFGDPVFVYMSTQTLEALKTESATVTRKFLPGVDRVFGLQIAKNECLPFGVVVVGGIVHDATEDLLKELEELEERVAIMSEGRPDIYCKDCKFFKVQDWWFEDGAIKVLGANNVPTCTKWGNGCKTNPDGYCHLAERKINNE